MSEYPDFTFEHVAINVTELEKAVDWYVENLDLVVARSTPGSVAFLADRTGRVLFELYEKPDQPTMDLHAIKPFTFHVAFIVRDVTEATKRLVAAGARVVDPEREADGDKLVMVQDPFGLTVQLVNRRTPMF